MAGEQMDGLSFSSVNSAPDYGLPGHGVLLVTHIAHLLGVHPYYCDMDPGPSKEQEKQ